MSIVDVIKFLEAHDIWVCQYSHGFDTDFDNYVYTAYKDNPLTAIETLEYLFEDRDYVKRFLTELMEAEEKGLVRLETIRGNNPKWEKYIPL